uniref:Uncharacterized protein LOC111105364 n=1 Tax=Crassostrea virginica TaxID=6565 RepID=A0A8B8AYC8_CRAVI|nr:uncharacterized protein LOC111105364 [Crassostrea virginica]
MAGRLTFVGVLLILTGLVSSGPSTQTPTSKVTTQQPVKDIFEYGYHFYRYDQNNHFLCVAHVTRYGRNCICYHVPHTEREQLLEPVMLLTVQRRMNALYVTGHHTRIEDIRYYSPVNYALCTDHGRQPNVTIDLVYD